MSGYSWKRLPKKGRAVVIKYSEEIQERFHGRTGIVNGAEGCKCCGSPMVQVQIDAHDTVYLFRPDLIRAATREEDWSFWNEGFGMQIKSRVASRIGSLVNGPPRKLSLVPDTQDGMEPLGGKARSE